MKSSGRLPSADWIAPAAEDPTRLPSCSVEVPTSRASTAIASAARMNVSTGVASAKCATAAGGERFGLTVGSLVSLSLQPPLVGISIGKDSSSHEPIRRAGGWTASLLSGAQAKVAQHFARSGIPPIALWNGVDVRDGTRGPLVNDALAWLECRTLS